MKILGTLAAPLAALALLSGCTEPNASGGDPDDASSEAGATEESSVQEPPPITKGDITKTSKFEWSDFTLDIRYADKEPYQASGVLIATDWVPARYASVGPPIPVGDNLSSEEAEATLEEYATLSDVIEANPEALIVNAGLLDPPQSGDGTAGRNAGLSYMNGIIISSLNETISGLVCVTSEHQQIAMYQTSVYAEDPAKIRDQCRSAFQAFPVVVSSGSVAINPTEVGRTNPRKRIIAGISRSDRRFLLVMDDPVHLLPIADLFVKGETAKVKVASASNKEFIDKYIRGVKGAINLPSAKSAIVVAEQQHLSVGDIDTVRSVLIFSE